MEKLCVQERPNGKLYRARKPPVVVSFVGGWPEEDSMMVLRIGQEDRDVAQALVMAEKDRYEFEMINTGYFGWWRDTIRNREQYWDYDSITGTPGWYFNVG